MVKSLALIQAQKKYYEKNKEHLRAKNNMNNKIRYELDSDYQEKIKLMALSRYYEKAIT